MCKITNSISDYTTIPSWVKHSARLQSSGLITDDEFLTSIKYLVDIYAIK
jgi:hypothetical protein